VNRPPDKPSHLFGRISPDPSPCDIVFVKVSPEEIVQGAWYRMPLLGLGYLAAYLREKGAAVAIVDALFDRLTLKETVERIVSRRPAMVGFTAMTHEVKRATQVAREVHRRLPEAILVVGGPHATALPRQTLEEFEVFNYAVFGEGEMTVHELWLAQPRNNAPTVPHTALENEAQARLKAIPGLVWRREGEIVENDSRGWIGDLDALPFPAWDLYGRADVYQIFASRGCPFDCIFCMRVLGEQVRFRSPGHVVDEFEWVVRNWEPERIDFSDETFTLRRRWVFEICDELIRRGLHTTPWFCNGRVNVVDEELLRRMREAGCVRIGFGIESGNAQILERAHKGTTIAQIESAVAACKRVGLETEAFYILGFPGETKETALDTLRLAARLNTTTAAFGIMVPYPGTEVAEMAARGEGGYRLLSRDWSDFDKHLGNALELETLTRQELERLQALAYLWFYVRNFRVRDLASFIWEKRKAAWRLAGKLVGKA